MCSAPVALLAFDPAIWGSLSLVATARLGHLETRISRGAATVQLRVASGSAAAEFGSFDRRLETRGQSNDGRRQ